MNPIPLSAPDGRVYAYACGVCHNVKASSFAVGPWPAYGPHRNLAEHSHRDAERCCVCSTCGARPASFYKCDQCNRERAERWMWETIGLCVKHGCTTRAQYDAWLEDDEDGK